VKEALGVFHFFCPPLQFQSQTFSTSKWWAPFLFHVYCKEIVKRNTSKEKNTRTIWKEITKDDYLITTCNVHSLECGVILQPIMSCSRGSGISHDWNRLRLH
jgi:hypothetical protein